MIVWIIGLSGSGKTTLANAVADIVRNKKRKIILLDGDVVREIFGNDLDHSLEGRRRNADRICALCRFLEEQGLDVVCAILSLFPESRIWNRTHLKQYFEVFIDAPIEQLIARDSKGIYGKFLRKETTSVAGMDLTFPVPEHADLTIKNDGSRESLLAHAATIADHIIRSSS